MRNLWLQTCGDVHVEAVSACLIVQPLLYLQHYLLLQKLFLLLFNLWWLRLLGGSTAFVAFVNHLNTKTFNWEAEVDWDCGKGGPWLTRHALGDLDLCLGIRESAVFRLALSRPYNHHGTV